MTTILDRPLLVTAFADLHGSEPKRYARSLRELARPIREKTAPTKARLPLLKLCSFGNVATPKGSFRHNANVTGIDGIEVDYDGESLPFDEAAKRLRDANVAALLYTSPSHKPDAPRWRVLCPCSHTIPPTERDALADRLNGILGGVLASESWALSQAFYFGKLDEAPDHRVEIIDGRAIDLATEIVGAPKPGSTTSNERPAVPNENRLGLSIEEIKNILEKLPFEEWGEQRDGWFRTGMAVHHETLGSEDGYNLWAEFSARSDKFNESDTRRVWKSFGGSAVNPVRMATLKQAVRHVEIAEMFEELDEEGGVEDDLFPPETEQNTEKRGGALAAAVNTINAARSLLVPDPNWSQKLDLNEESHIKATLHNLTLIIRNDPRTRSLAALNEFTQEVVQRGQPGRFKMKKEGPKGTKQLDGPFWNIRDTVNGELWSDTRDNAIRDVIEAPTRQGGYSIRVTDRDLKAAIDLVSRDNTFHPVREYIESHTWDGQPRLETAFIRHLGAPDNSYSRSVAKLVLIAGVTRIYEPGAKFDFALILEGMQGKRKSTFINILSHGWFAELTCDFSDARQNIEMMQGAWVLEIPELSGFNKSDVRVIKGFISRTVDKGRLAYARRAQNFPRQCIFIGTTNDREYLRDDTGGRRFWPLECTVDEIDTDAFEQEVDQLWAEAYAMYRAIRSEQPRGTLPLYLTDASARSTALVLQEDRRVESSDDALAGEIAKWLDSPIVDETGFDDLEDLCGGPSRRNETCLIEIWCDCLGRDKASYIASNAASQALGRAMKKLPDWSNIGVRETKKNGRQRVYRRFGYDPAGIFNSSSTPEGETT